MSLAVAFAVGTALLSREQQETLAALGDAKAQRARAEERELSARRQLYAAHIAAAARAWDVASLGEVRRLLDWHVPGPGEEDLRGIEWHYLLARCRAIRRCSEPSAGHTDEVYCARFSPDGKWLATAGKDRTARLWEPATGKEVAVLRGHENEVNWAAFSPDGTALATASDDGTVKLWDVATGRETGQIVKAPVAVVGVAFSPDGKILAAGLEDGTVRWWDLPSLRERPSFRAHPRRIEALDFSPDGRTLATCAIGDNTRLWDAGTAGLRHTLLANMASRCVNFSRRGDKLAAAGLHGEMRLWAPTTGDPLLNLSCGALTPSPSPPMTGRWRRLWRTGRCDCARPHREVD